MIITITYSDYKGDVQKRELEFEKDVRVIDFDDIEITDLCQTQAIDLSSLASSSTLEILKLTRKGLQIIDLAPLASCSNLQILNLGWNKLESIDLSPLASCTNLKTLDLGVNMLKNIDLTPLVSCSNLEKLMLFTNQLQTIDLTPLASCSNLKELWVQKNPLQGIDLSPLSSCTKLDFLDISEVIFPERYKDIKIVPAAELGLVDRTSGSLELFYDNISTYYTWQSSDKGIIMYMYTLERIKPFKYEVTRLCVIEESYWGRNVIEDMDVTAIPKEDMDRLRQEVELDYLRLLETYEDDE